MKNEISKVLAGSIAEELEVEVGDKLVSINGEQVKDVIDYKFLMADEFVVIEIEKPDGEVWELEVEKDYDENLGIEFKESIMDKPRSCHNKCIFCFIDQLPKGMRNTLYFKDDDSRLAFLQGNFVTLTNMSDEDINRIIKYRISPINVSVHTTNPELREKMLNNRFAGNVYERLKRMAEAGIEMNCQVVSCPGINNGKELSRTVQDLYALCPSVSNVAVVPVGVTKFRERLAHLDTYTSEEAQMELKGMEQLQKKYMEQIGRPFVRLSDEFYILANAEMPDAEFYGGYEQLEDGVGVTRLFRDNIESKLEELHMSSKGRFSIVTGILAQDEVKNAASKIMKRNNNLSVDVHCIMNNFFGNKITISGLITAGDIIEQTKGLELGKFVLIPDTMLRKGYEPGNKYEQVFLDDVSVEELEKALNRKVVVCDYTGEDLIELINVNCKEE